MFLKWLEIPTRQWMFNKTSVHTSSSIKSVWSKGGKNTSMTISKSQLEFSRKPLGHFILKCLQQWVTAEQQVWSKNCNIKIRKKYYFVHLLSSIWFWPIDASNRNRGPHYLLNRINHIDSMLSPNFSSMIISLTYKILCNVIKLKCIFAVRSHINLLISCLIFLFFFLWYMYFFCPSCFKIAHTCF